MAGELRLYMISRLQLFDSISNVRSTDTKVQEDAIQKGKTEKEYVNTKMMTRQTYSLDGISGVVEVKDGKAIFTEKDGIDYAATTVQMPGGERVPFLFSVKNLIATGSDSTIKPGFEMGGSFTVPSYRTGLFLDPKGRGTTTGYDFAGALPGLQNGYEGVGEEKLFEENNKKFDVLSGMDTPFGTTSSNLSVHLATSTKMTYPPTFLSRQHRVRSEQSKC